MSANIGDFQAFWYGIRWGIGHSIGLLLVGSILIVIDLSRRRDKYYDEDSHMEISEKFESLCESLVGIFMILLGLYSMMNILQNHGTSNNGVLSGVSDENFHSETERVNHPNLSNISDIEEERQTIDNEGEAEIQLSNSAEVMIPVAYETYDAMDTSPPLSQNSVGNLIHHHHNHHHNHENCLDCCSCIIPKPVLSLGIGVIHGVAGPGGVLGVLPAVQLHDWKLATIYLGTFCITSTITMGSYAAIYGSCSSHISKRNASTTQFYIEMFSAGLSLFVGVLWLFLLSIGKLHDIFP